jgi:tRNA dimethylallyltransferase
MTSFKQLALIGPTASGKTALALALAHKSSANILSLDSLALYKEIDIASAKPSLKERDNIIHFGIDELQPNELFDVTTVIELYKKAKRASIEENKNLIIVGGTGFYLSSLINGISNLPTISKNTKEKSNELLINVESAHNFLNNLDPKYMSSIKNTDAYRIEKMLNLYFETHLTPTAYFKKNLPIPTITDNLPIYEIEVDREILRKRIQQRTDSMIALGLIDEVVYLEKKYTRKPNCMKSIGIKEVLAYLDGHYTKKEMKERISIHTGQLAKRQRTFNKSQFQNKSLLPLEELQSVLLKNS